MRTYLVALALIPAVAVAAVQTPSLRGEGVEDQRQLSSGDDYYLTDYYESVWWQLDKIAYHGCIQDYSKDRWFEHGYFLDHNDGMSHQKCKWICMMQVDKPIFMGLQFGKECWCSNKDDLFDINKGTEIDDSLIPQRPMEECNMPCNGKAKDNCGGKWRVFVVQIGREGLQYEYGDNTTW